MIKGVLASLAIIIVAFIVLRGVMLWYWKINEIVMKLDQILTELKKVNDKNLIR
jgi:hypothetical protein